MWYGYIVCILLQKFHQGTELITYVTLLFEWVLNPRSWSQETSTLIEKTSGQTVPLDGLSHTYFNTLSIKFLTILAFLTNIQHTK